MISAFFVLAILAAGTTIARNAILHPEPTFLEISVTAAQPERNRVSRRLPRLINDSYYYVPTDQRELVAAMETEKQKKIRQREQVLAKEAEKKARQAAAAAAFDEDYSNDLEDEEAVEVVVEEDVGLNETSVEEELPASPPFSLFTAEEISALEWEPNTKLRYMATEENTPFLVRSFDKVRLEVTGTIDFSSCWDWNTKAIYVAFVVMYSTPTAEYNEFTFADVVLRPPPSRRHLPVGIRNLTVTDPFTWSADDLDRYKEHLSSLSNHHDPVGLVQDPYLKQIHLKHSLKYLVEDYDTGHLPLTHVAVKMRYQVMSYSGWAPLKENSLSNLSFELMHYAPE